LTLVGRSSVARFFERWIDLFFFFFFLNKKKIVDEKRGIERKIFLNKNFSHSFFVSEKEESKKELLSKNFWRREESWL